MSPSAEEASDGGASRVAIVTGGYSGIGAAIAEALAGPGVRVVVAGRHPERADGVLAGLRSRGHDAAAIGLDVTDPDSVDAAFSALDRVDVLVNCVGSHSYRAIEDLTVGAFQDVLGPNLIGTFLTCQRALPLMGAGGRIVNLTSRLLLGGREVAHYAAAKAGVVGFTRALAAEVLGRRITANAVAPALVDTPSTRQAIGDERVDAAAKAAPLGRLVRAEEVAGTVAFLASESAAAITGQCLFVDGGIDLPR